MSFLGLLNGLHFYFFYFTFINFIIKDIFVNGINKTRFTGNEEKQVKRKDIKYRLHTMSTFIRSYRYCQSADLGRIEFDEKESLLIKDKQSSKF